METTRTSPVTLTPGAIAQVRKLMNQERFDRTRALRIGVKGGGCSGMSYLLGFDQVFDSDVHFQVEDIPCIVNRNQEIYLHGIVIDWREGLHNRGFTFKNPNASKTCGCGTSFAV